MGLLRQAGFVMLNIPQTGIDPLDLLIKTSRHTVERLNASVEDLFDPEVNPLPDIEDNQTLTDLNAEEDLDLKLETDINFLDGLFKFFKSSLSTTVSYGRDRHVKIQLLDPKKDVVNIVRLANSINDSSLCPAADMFQKQLNKAEIYIVTETIKAKTILVHTGAETGIKGEAKADATKIVEASAAVTSQQQRSDRLDYSGDEYLVCAIKAYRLKKRDNKPGKFTIDSPGDVRRVLSGEFLGEPLEINHYLEIKQL